MEVICPVLLGSVNLKVNSPEMQSMSLVAIGTFLAAVELELDEVVVAVVDGADVEVLAVAGVDVELEDLLAPDDPLESDVWSTVEVCDDPDLFLEVAESTSSLSSDELLSESVSSTMARSSSGCAWDPCSTWLAGVTVLSEAPQPVANRAAQTARDQEAKRTLFMSKTSAASLDF